MNKSVVIGVIVLVLMIAGGLVYRFVLAPSDGRPVQAAQTGIGSGRAPEVVKPKPFQYAAPSGYALETIDLGGKQVPLLRIPLDVWGGYAALFAANGGAQASQDSVFFKNSGFAVELVPTDSAQAQIDGYVQGRFPIIWSTMDSLPVLHHAFKSDRRIIPQVFGIFDWSVGGDGILVRSNIRTPKDLKGKKVLTSGNTPYNFFLLWLLAQSNIAPSELTMLYLDDGAQALEAFRKDRSIDALVIWEPFVSSVLDQSSPDAIKDVRLLINSRDANQLIADIFLARLDFARENPQILKGFVEGMIRGQQLLEKNSEPVLATMAAFWKLEGGPAEARRMIRDVHIPNWTESRMFFDIANPINAYKIYYMAQSYFQNVGSIPSDSSLDAEGVISARFLEELEAVPEFAAQPNRVKNSFNKQAAFDIADLESQRIVMTEDLEIFFEAQQLEFDLNGPSPEMRKNRQNLDRVAEQMSILGTTVLKLVGHLDTTRVQDFKAQGQQAFIEASAQAKLISKKRAEYIKKLLVTVYKVDGDRIFTEGRGWDQPINAENPSVNRRVEVQFIGFE